MKKVSRMLSLLLALTCLFGASALAESAVLLWEADSISTLYAADNLVEVYMRDQGYGFATPAGEITINLEHKALHDIECIPGYGIASVPNNDVHNSSLISPTNVVLTEELYADIVMFSENWFAGFIVKETASDDGDYFGGGKEYLIDRVDIYYAPNGKVASLTRDQYGKAKAYGDHLLVLDRNNGVQLYDSQFNPVESSFKTFVDGEFYAGSKGLTRGIYSRVTGAQIATGYSKVSSETLNGNVLAVYSESAGGWGLIDLQGNVIVPCAEDVEFYDLDENKYIRFTQNDTYGVFGVYDLTTGKQVVPCEYNSILSADYENYNFYGYFAVEKDEKVGYVDENGNVTVALTYAEDDVKVLGCTMFQEDNGVFTLIAADGVVSTLQGVTDICDSGNYASLGRYIVVKNAEDKWGVMDWHGSMVVDYSADSEYDFRFISPTHFIFEGKFMYEIQ